MTNNRRSLQEVISASGNKLVLTDIRGLLNEEVIDSSQGIQLLVDKSLDEEIDDMENGFSDIELRMMGVDIS